MTLSWLKYGALYVIMRTCKMVVGSIATLQNSMMVKLSLVVFITPNMDTKYPSKKVCSVVLTLYYNLRNCVFGY